MRNGVGVGSLNEKGDLRSRVSFVDEPEGSYRIYEYTVMSRQYSLDGRPTGNWYGGTFVRDAAASAGGGQ